MRSGPLRKGGRGIKQIEKCPIEVSSPEHRSILNALAHPKLDTLQKLNHLLTYIVDLYAIPFGTRYAVYDPILSLRPFSEIPLHRLRLDLPYPKPLFSHCPRGEEQKTKEQYMAHRCSEFSSKTAKKK